MGLHPEENAPVVELVFTRLHAGGKFDKQGGGAYAFSGGLHGVGVSVTNALATRLEVVVWRDGGVNRLVFRTARSPSRWRRMPKADARVRHPRARLARHQYFDSPTIPLGELTHLLRSKAVLLPGVKVMLVNEKTGDTKTWQYQDGLRGYLAKRWPAPS